MAKLTDVFSAQLEREAAISRRVLERVPEGRPDWKPHEKSMPLGYLSTLVAMMPSWVAMAVTQDELDINPAGGSAPKPPEWRTTRELLQAHDESVAKGRAALRATTDEHLMTSWRLLASGQVVLENPRHVVIADTYTHLAHHRGQLTVYLRLNGAPVPSIYGPSADERSFGG
ncbi:MAG TPA: DinB family protein [Vicinamibacterales bacterium]|nr:DinB family protein [Vicinamibacterales bacterium]